MAKSNLFGCIKNNFINGWHMMLIIFVIYIIIGPVYMFVGFNEQYENFKQNEKWEAKVYQEACYLIQEGEKNITEKEYESRYSHKLSTSYHQISRYLTAPDVKVYYDSRIDYYEEGLRDDIEDFYGAYGIVFIGIVGFLAVFFSADKNFSFDKGKKNTDFYGALPVTRLEYYISSVICTFCFAFIPLVVSALLTVPMLSALGALNFISLGKLWGYAFLYILSALIYFLEFTSLAVIANIIGNSKAIAFLCYLIEHFCFAVYIGVGMLISDISSGTFSTFISKIEGFEDFIFSTSPSLRMAYTVSNTPFAFSEPHVHIIYLLIALVILAGGYFIFALRRAENSVIPCAFSKLRYVLQYLSMILAALLMNIIFESMSNMGIVGMCFISIISSFLVFMCFNAVFEGSIRMLLKNIKHMFILYGSTVFLMIFVFGDIFGLFVVPEPNKNNMTRVTVSFNDGIRLEDVEIGGTYVTVDRSSSQEAIDAAFDLIEFAKMNGYSYDRYTSLPSASVSYVSSSVPYFEITEKYGSSEGFVPLNKKLYSNEEYIDISKSALQFIDENAYEYGIDYYREFQPYIRIEVEYGLFRKSYSLNGYTVESVDALLKLGPLSEWMTPYHSIIDSAFDEEISITDLYELSLSRIDNDTLSSMHDKKYVSDGQLSAVKVALKKDLDKAVLKDLSVPSPYALVARKKGSPYEPSSAVILPESFVNTIEALKEFGCVADVDGSIEAFSAHIIAVDTFEAVEGMYRMNTDIMKKARPEESKLGYYADIDKVEKLLKEGTFVPFDVCRAPLLRGEAKEWHKLYAFSSNGKSMVTYDVFY